MYMALRRRAACRLAAYSAGSRGRHQPVLIAAVSSAADERPSSTSAAGGEPEHWPVVIVGAGPTGLTLSALLSRMGVRSLLLERAAALTQHPQVYCLCLRVRQEVAIVAIPLARGNGVASSRVDAFGRPLLAKLRLGYQLPAQLA